MSRSWPSAETEIDLYAQPECASSHETERAIKTSDADVSVREGVVESGRFG